MYSKRFKLFDRVETLVWICTVYNCGTGTDESIKRFVFKRFELRRQFRQISDPIKDTVRWK